MKQVYAAGQDPFIEAAQTGLIQSTSSVHKACIVDTIAGREGVFLHSSQVLGACLCIWEFQIMGPLSSDPSDASTG